MERYFRNEKVLFGFLILVFLFTRLYNLTLLPIFTDESIYIYWAKYIVTSHSHWFIALTDGKPPVLTWIIGILLSIFSQSWYLIAGRLPSVFFGLITLLGTYKLAKFFFNDRIISVVSGALVIFSPFLLVYDRLALYDSQLCAMLVWSVYFCMKTAKTLSWRDVLLWGGFLGLAFLSKPPALLYLLISPICFFLMIKIQTLKKHWVRVLFLLLSVVVISEVMNNLQRVSGAFHAAEIKNQQFEQPLAEIIKHPFELLPSNMYQFITWLISYYTLPLFLAVLASFVFIIVLRKREGIVLFLLWFLPILAFAIAGREIFPRYLLFITPFAMVPLAFSLGTMWRRRGMIRILSMVSFALVLFLPVVFSYFLLTDPTRAPLPLADYNQLVAEHPSGYGLARVFSYIRAEEKKGNLTVVTQGTFGLYPYAFYLEFWGDPHVRILPKWPLKQLDQEVYDARKNGDVLVVMKDEKDLPPELTELQLIEKILKPNSLKYPIVLSTFK